MCIKNAKILLLLLLFISCGQMQEREVVVVKKINPWSSLGAPRLVIEDTETHERAILNDDNAPYLFDIGDTIKIRITQFE